MLSFQGRSARLCDGLSRREWLKVGGISAGALSLADLLRIQNAKGADPLQGDAPKRLSGFGQAKHCIVLFLLGGPPQHETWDPKPEAPEEVRGQFGSIETATPGLRVGELMPLTAKLTNKIAVLRALATDDNAHSSSGYWMLTGHPHAPKNSENALPGAPNNWPSIAAVVRHLKGDSGALPGSVRLPEEIWNTGRLLWPGQDAGWLDSQSDPWLITCDPNKPDFRVPDIALPNDISSERFAQRRDFLHALNRRLDQIQSHASVQRWTSWQSKAVELLQTPAAQRAFALDKETEAVRDRYGRNRFGQSVLLARRMIEAGVSLVQVNWTRWENDEDVAPAWDSHAKHNERIKNALMPPMDQAYSALLEDLEQSGLLDETLVVWIGEFGRTPRFNAAGGRDHWGHVFSGALAGGGVKGGTVFGASDRQGAYPLEGRVEPQDLAATIFHCLGFGPSTELKDRFGRPLAISNGTPIQAIL
ncbi:hypothetical protein VN12_22545 [Pirellula sp. SH-Sr6A]|uniref:DUF1501 domain-containing protein n=1 Tax=Pirellula sp. SH-Sr6A TaxID=1632865 RepID=UPI00078E97D0|nr:DUF1501 domain-containing protein [Pirellula sp. SH-Sr6A]AMV34924.1 hypothetical protein VN12_22545 [Pirellula sp. SH-Sr6A]